MASFEKMRTIPLLSLCLFLAGMVFGQGPAGSAVHYDYDDFTNDNIRRFVNCGNSGFLNPGNELTMEAWLRIHDSGWNQKIFGKLNPNFNSGYMLAVDQGKIYPEVWNPTQSELLVGFIPPLGFWVHFAVTFIAGDSMRAYVNGEKVGATDVGAGGIATNNDNLIIGIAPWDLSNFQYFGDLDEVRLWSVARSEADINDAMHRELTGSETGLLAYYQFNEGLGNTTTADGSGNGNTGTFVGLTANDWSDSYAVIGNSTVSSLNDLAAMWNGKQYVNPRFAITDNGLSMTTEDIVEWDYVVFAHDVGTGTSTADIPAGTSNFERAGRVWYVNAVGDVPADLTFDLGNAAGGGTALTNAQPAANYGLLYRSGTSGAFTVVAQGTAVNGNTVTFDAVDLVDGYYTIGVGDAAVVGLEESLEGNQLLHIWPNPAAQGLVNLRFEGWSGVAQLQVLNVMGQEVLRKEVVEMRPDSRVSVDVSGLAAGMYYLRLETEGGVYTRKLRLK